MTGLRLEKWLDIQDCFVLSQRTGMFSETTMDGSELPATPILGLLVFTVHTYTHAIHICTHTHTQIK